MVKMLTFEDNTELMKFCGPLGFGIDVADRLYGLKDGKQLSLSVKPYRGGYRVLMPTDGGVAALATCRDGAGFAKFLKEFYCL